MNITDFNFRFEDIKCSDAFTCKRCGNCCFRQGNQILLTYPEISRIQDYLIDFVRTDKFDNFVNNIIAWTKGDIQYFEKVKADIQEGMIDFFSIMPLEKDGQTYVMFYLLRNLKESNRCILFDPITKECVIYSVRPYVCKLYPFMVAYDLPNKVITIYVDKRHKLSKEGKCIHREELKKLAYDFIIDSLKHESAFKEFTGIDIHTRVSGKDSFSSSEDAYWNERFTTPHQRIGKTQIIDPFFEQKLVMKNDPLWKRIEEGKI